MLYQIKHLFIAKRKKSRAFVSSLVVLQFPSSSERLKLIQIIGLPLYDECCYTEEELAEVLKPFGFQYMANVIFVLPQLQMVRIHHSCTHFLSKQCH